MKKLLISAIMALTLLIPSFAHADNKESYTNTIKFDNKILLVLQYCSTDNYTKLLWILYPVN